MNSTLQELHLVPSKAEREAQHARDREATVLEIAEGALRGWERELKQCRRISSEHGAARQQIRAYRAALATARKRGMK